MRDSYHDEEWALGTLSFWLNVTSSETTTTTVYDRLFFEVRSTTGVLLGTLASYSNAGGPVDVAAPGGDAPQTPGTVFGRGRILAGWSSTDATGLWEALSGVNRAITSGGGRYVWISGTSMPRRTRPGSPR